MLNIYVYVMDTMADWELGYAIAELHSGRFFKKGAPRVSLRTVSDTQAPILTMGGMRIMPDCFMEAMAVGETGVLLLPGADTWGDPRHRAIIEKAGTLLAAGGVVCAICGATAALANAELLDRRRHTSNGPGFLEMVSPAYKGQDVYVDEPSVTEGNLITAGSTGALLWAKQIIAHLGVFQANTLASWYDYYRTGASEHFFALMQSLPSGKNNA